MLHTASDLGAEVSLPPSAAVAMRRHFGAPTSIALQPWRDAARLSPPAAVDDPSGWDDLTAIAENLGLL